MTSWHDGRRRVISSASPAARALGLRPGLPLAEAQARVPGLVVREAAPAREAAALRRLARLSLRYAPHTAPVADGVLIDATGCAHLFGGERRLLDTMARDLGAQGFTVRAAIAATPACAHAVARFAQQQQQQQQAGGSHVVVAPGDEEATLAPLPVEALRIEADTAASLRRLGLGTVGAVRLLPRAQLGRRFGAGLLLRLDQAAGGVFEPIGPEAPERTVAARLGFVEPLLTADAFGAVIARLAADVARQLERAALGARRLELGFERVDGARALLRAATARPVRDPALLARLLTARLETVDPGLGVEAMFLRVRRADGLDPKQEGIEPSHGIDTVAPLIDSLANRLGAGRVWREAAVESDVPERSVARIEPLSAPDDTSWPARLPRPVRLLDPPQPVEVMALLPDHPPASFFWRRVRHRVRHADGPERIAGEWWRGPGEVRALRDYFRVEDDAGGRFWLFRRGDGVDPETGDMRWFVHGLF